MTSPPPPNEPPPDDGPTLPTSPWVERAVLGSTLYEGDLAADKLLAKVRPNDFSTSVNQAVFGAIAAIREAGLPVGFESVDEYLRLHPPGVHVSLADFLGEEQLLDVGLLDVAVELGVRRRTGLALNEIAHLVLDRARTEDVESAVARAHEVLAEALSGVGADPTANEVPLRTLPEFLAEVDPEEDWIFRGLLERNDRMVFVAPEGQGKSVILRCFAVAAVLGRNPFTPTAGTPGPSHRSLLVELETPPRIVRKTLDQIVTAARKIAPTSSLGQMSVWPRHGGIDLRTRRDRLEFEEKIRECLPDLVCIGPAYKAYRMTGNESEERAVLEVFDVLDDLRTRYGFALVMEHHAPHDRKPIRPIGTTAWLRWPEFGIGLTPSDDNPKALDWSSWRGDRDTRTFPRTLERSAGADAWPWVASWPTGTLNNPEF